MKDSLCFTKQKINPDLLNPSRLHEGAYIVTTLSKGGAEKGLSTMQYRNKMLHCFRL